MQLGHVKLDIDEEVLGMIHRSKMVLIPRLILGFFWVLLPFFFFFQLLAGGILGVFFFALILCTGIWYTWISFKKWQGTMWLLTERRILDIDQQNLRRRLISEINYDDIDDIQVSQGRLFERIFSLRTIVIKTKKREHFDLELDMVPRATDIANLIHDVQYLNADAGTASDYHKQFHETGSKTHKKA